MITKEMFCKLTIKKYLESNDLTKVSELTEVDVYRSTSVGLAMDYLGMGLKGEALDYLAGRAGTYKLYVNEAEGEAHVLTFREMLDMLPEKLSEGE